MIQDPKDKNSESEVHKITLDNNPNDDEEVLKNNDEPNRLVDTNDENQADGNKDQSESTETIGIP
jgi:hypothetical protein